MKLLNSRLYIEDLEYVANLDLPWEKLDNKSVMISGATGMIGSFLIDVLMYRNRYNNVGTHIVALGRDDNKLKSRFEDYLDSKDFSHIQCDINKPIDIEMLKNENKLDAITDTKDVQESLSSIDYILHLASSTHPLQYATDPIGTITANVFGTYNLLEYAAAHDTKRFVFASSNEIYGENRGDVELFSEDYMGYIDSNTLRAGYPESKRCSEALCQAYAKQKNIDIVIPRLTRSYGPTLLNTDTKAMSQFIHKAISGEDIVLKSAGTQYYSYTYVADAVSGLITVMLCGNSGEAYNIADTMSDIMLKDLAKTIAEAVGRKVVFEIPDSTEQAGYSKATKARLSGEKLKELGWHMEYDIKAGINRTIEILKSI